MDYMTFLIGLHRFLSPRTYIEIGVHDGDTLSLADCLSIGIDPSPSPKARELITQTRKLYETTSDEFFETMNIDDVFDGMKVDLAFIHFRYMAERVLRDFINIERNASFGTLVVFHDVLPAQEDWEGRQQKQSNWCGDVWKIVPCLRKHRPDLGVVVLDCPPSGLALVSSLDPTSAILQDRYKLIERELFDNIFPGVDVLRDMLQPIAPQASYFSRFLCHRKGGASVASPYRENLEHVHPVLPKAISDLMVTRPSSQVRELHKIGQTSYRVQPAMFFSGPEEDPAFERAASVVTGDFHEVTDAAHLVELADVTVVSQAGLIKFGDNTFLSESMWDLDDSALISHFTKNNAMMIDNLVGKEKEQFLWTTEKRTIIEGPCFLAKKRWYNSYGHWLMEILPKILWARRAGFDGTFVIGPAGGFKPDQKSAAAAVLEVFPMLGIPKEKIIQIDDGELVDFDRLVYASPLSWNPNFIHPILKDLYDEFVRTKLEIGRKGSEAGREKLSRIFVTRNSDGRNCLNEAELVNIARRYGFVPVDPGAYQPFAEEVRLFTEAEIIIGVHGSGMANCVFAPDSCRILLLGSVIFPDRFFHRLFSTMGQRYGVLFGVPDERRDVLHSHFLVDPKRFEEALRRVI